MLTSRLRRLEDGGVITGQQCSQHPPRYEYMLTEARQALVPLLRSLRRWGQKYGASAYAAARRHRPRAAVAGGPCSAI